jgi:hypothetical protein
MDTSAFVAKHPRLYHVALARNVRQISRHGLKSTSVLLNLADASQASRRPSLESARRATVAELQLSDGTKAYLRDHLPISDKNLRRLLEPGMTLEEWYRLLNARLFFWLSLEAAMEFAASYPDADQILYAFDTARLLAAHGARVAVSQVHSGATRGNLPRGKSTFLRLEEATPKMKLVELTVEGEVPDAMALCVERWSVAEGRVVARLDLAAQ